MTQDEIIKMAKQAGCETAFGLTHPPILQAVAFKKPQLETFAKLVAAKERWECAQLCEDWDSDEAFVSNIAEAIRARGEA